MQKHYWQGIAIAAVLISGCSDEQQTPLSPSPIAESTGSATGLASTTAATATAQTAQTAQTAGAQDQLTDIEVRGLTVNRESKRVQALTADPGTGKVTLRWSPPADEGGIVRYRYSMDNLRWWRKISGGPNARTVTVTGLNGGQEYQFRVRAQYQNHYGPTARTTATPTGGGPARPPETVTNLTYKLAGSMITLSWWVPNMRGAELLRYETRTRVGVGNWSDWHNAGKTPTWRYASHAPGEERTYEVRAVNRIGPGGRASVTVDNPALSGSAPGTVRNFTHTDLGNYRQRLAWTRPTNWSSADPARTVIDTKLST